MRALEIFQQMGTPHMAMKAVACLARVALDRDDLNTALRHVEIILAHLAGGGTLDGTEEPLRIRLAYHLALLRTGDPRAVEVLAAAHADLMSQAKRISDAELRDSFLHRVPHHIEIVAAAARAPTENALKIGG